MWMLALVSAALAYPIVDKPLDEGFNRVRVDFGGFIQPRFRWSPDDLDAGALGEQSFSVQRMRLQLQTDLLSAPDDRWGFHVSQTTSIEMMPEARLEDGFIDLGFGTEFQIRVGQFKAPIHRAILAGDQNNLFPDRNQITTYVPEREIGAMLFGWWGKRQIEWSVGVFNGEGKNRIANVNRDFMYAGRIVFAPFGSPGPNFEILHDWRPEGVTAWRPIFSVGYSVFHNVDGPAGEREAYTGHNVEGFLHWRPLTLQSEFFFRTSDFENTTVADYQQIGWYVQAGYFLAGIPWAKRHLALMGRVEQGDAFKPISQSVPASGPLDPAQASRRYSVGLGVYANRPLFRFVQDLRAVVSYTVKQELEDYPIDNDELNVTASLSF
jgi:hypothetical protein